jgi:hypothetical protein
MKYVKQRMSMHSGNARYSAMPGVSRGLSSGRRELGQVPEAM